MDLINSINREESHFVVVILLLYFQLNVFPGSTYIHRAKKHLQKLTYNKTKTYKAKHAQSDKPLNEKKKKERKR